MTTLAPEETGRPDCLEAVSGPGDGIEFPITRTPIDIGSDPECGVLLQFDRRVHPSHARVTVVSEGYRVRQLDGGPVYVDGKRAGKLRSRIARTGSIVQVGDTELLVQCAPDGLASRSRGMPLESDAGWALRLAFPVLLSLLAVPFRSLLESLGRLSGRLILLVVLLLALSHFLPGPVRWALGWIRYAWEWVRYALG